MREKQQVDIDGNIIKRRNKIWNEFHSKTGTRTSRAKVTIDGTDYIVTPAQFSGSTPLSAYIMNRLQTNIENAINQNADNIGGEEYDDTATYEEGDIVIYEGQLYVCIEAIETAEEFDNTKWQEISVLEAIDNIQPLPVGGTQGQVLTKNSSQDGDAIWSDQTGGDIVFVGDEEDTPEDTVLLIESEELANLGSEVVNSLSGNEETKAPSVKAVNDALLEKADIVYKEAFAGSTSGTYTFPSGGLYLLITMTNGNNTAIVDVIMVRGQAYYHRLSTDSNSYKTVTYSGATVTITNNQYNTFTTIFKLY